MSDTPQVFIDEAPTDEQVKAIQDAVQADPNAQASVVGTTNVSSASDSSSSATTVGTDAPTTSSASEAQPSPSPVLTGATPSAPIEGALNPSNALAGTSGVPAGQLSTGMAAGEPVVKLSSAIPAEQEHPQLDLGDTPTNVNVLAVGAPHPVVHKVGGLVAELRLIIGNIEKSPAIMRAEKDLQTFEEWVVQHFEDLKRKL